MDEKWANMTPSRLKTLTEEIHDKNLRRKVVELMKKPEFKLEDESFPSLTLDTSPAGLSHHHSYPRGYVEHVTSTANLAIAMCDSVERVYGGKVNRDLVIAGVLLHDIFKPATYAKNGEGNFTQSPLADYLDHLSLATAELIRRDFPIELVHIVAAHHGDYGPIRPHTIEALICHLADFMDSRLNGQILRAAGYLARRATGEELPNMNSTEALRIIQYKIDEGWAGVARAMEENRQVRRAHKA